MRLIITYLIGLIFGIGITLGGMANPAKVQNFFDIAGRWDPSLILVMGGALVVTAIGYRLVARRQAPVFGGRFTIPSSRLIDGKLVGGAVVFGIGWGLSGYCPGGVLPALGTLDAQVWIFFAAMLTGMGIARRMLAHGKRAAPGPRHSVQAEKG